MWQTAALNLSLPPLIGSLLFSSHTQTWTHKPPIDCSYILEFIHYPYPSASITQPITAPRPQPHTHTGSDTLTHTNTKTQIHFTAGE